MLTNAGPRLGSTAGGFLRNWPWLPGWWHFLARAQVASKPLLRVGLSLHFPSPGSLLGPFISIKGPGGWIQDSGVFWGASCGLMWLPHGVAWPTPGWHAMPATSHHVCRVTVLWPPPSLGGVDWVRAQSLVGVLPYSGGERSPYNTIPTSEMATLHGE